MSSLIAFFTAVISFFTMLFSPAAIKTDCIFSIDASRLSEETGNMAKCINVWEMGSSFISPERNAEHDIFEFVEYVQLMACSGGTVTRDLFKDPLDRTVLDDYDFSNLIKNCRGILSLGAKPHLKFGNTPLKLTDDPQKGVFSDNINPPDNYDAYYNYIKAAAEALSDEFGKDEVASWHFGVMTEYENSDWFTAKSGDPAETAAAYCKLYDYTAAALQDVLGDDIYIGAHSMSVTEGLWDEEIFIRHCAKGVNYKTGEQGARLCYLSASFYDSRPGVYTSGKTLPETINDLRATAEKYGLYGLDYGIDEGRILSGNSAGKDSSEIMSRSSGFTWQAAYDARQYGQMLDSGIDYFSYWDFLSGGLFKGNPSVSYYVSREISKYAGSRKAQVKTVKNLPLINREASAHAVYNENDGTLRAFVYNYSKKLDHTADCSVMLNVSVPDFADGTATVTAYRINDDCNFFDEWLEDRKLYGITDDMFSWSPDDFMIDSLLTDTGARELYFGTLYEKYAACSVLRPDTFTVKVKNGKLLFTDDIAANTVTFYEINQ